MPTTITGFTAGRMKEIEDASVVDGSVVGDNLILERYDGAFINAGSVRGPQGIQGAAGEVSTAQLNDAVSGLQSDIVNSVPIGSITMFAGDAAPTNWALAQGQAVSRTTYAALFALIGTSYGPGNGTTTFNLPDLRDRFVAGLGPTAWASSRNLKGGSKDGVVITHTHGMTHNHPTAEASSNTHVHAAHHGHAASIGNAGAHAHIFNTRDNMNAGGNLGEPMISNSTGTASVRGMTGAPDHSHTITVNISYENTGGNNHVHTVPIANSATTSTAAPAGAVPVADTNLPPYIVLNYIIKVL